MCNNVFNYTIFYTNILTISLYFNGAVFQIISLHYKNPFVRSEQKYIALSNKFCMYVFYTVFVDQCKKLCHGNRVNGRGSVHRNVPSKAFGVTTEHRPRHDTRSVASEQSCTEKPEQCNCRGVVPSILNRVILPPSVRSHIFAPNIPNRIVAKHPKSRGRIVVVHLENKTFPLSTGNSCPEVCLFSFWPQTPRRPGSIFDVLLRFYCSLL